MRTVELAEKVSASSVKIDSHLDPPTIIEYEGSFEVVDFEEKNEEWYVTAGSSGLRLNFRFESLENGYYYELKEDQPLEKMETTLQYQQSENGTEISITSAVRMGRWPAAVTDRVAAWKRKGELNRMLEHLHEEFDG